MTGALADGRVALVTGAARGIGAATARTLARRGWHVMAVDLAEQLPQLDYALGSPADLERAVESARNEAVDPSFVEAAVADVRDPAELQQVVDDISARWGGLDAAVACAGVIAGGAPQWELPIDQERAVLDINLGGTLALARVAVPALLARPEPRSGRFVAVSSAAATRGLPLLAAYGASKAGVEATVRALGVELAGTGVTANAVSPGSTATGMLDESARIYGLEGAQAFAGQQPIRRLIDPDEVARVIAFVAAEDNRAMTGTVVAVDGGLSL